MATTHRGQADKSALEKAAQAFAQTKLGSTLFTTVFPAIDRKVMPLTRGKVRMSLHFPSLVLHCRGAKSGEPREVPLLYTPRGEQLILVASRGGHERHPAWYHNLKAHPDVEVEIDGRRRPMRAREAAGAERAELWALVTDNYNGYATYQQRAGDRRIPVMVLEPR
ncbi:MAG TPA: nitroreductase/quinone reductase family protein [Baekduia sp.]|nr:nitroreductase/quinone reductase family protein [Baekduia sp.]